MVYAVDQSATDEAVLECLYLHREEDSLHLLNLTLNDGKAARGIGERACGLWTLSEGSESKSKTMSWLRFTFDLSGGQGKKKKASTKKQSKKLEATKKELKSISNSLEKLGRASDYKCLFLHFPCPSAGITPNARFKFGLVSFGTSSSVNAVDMRDILGPRIESTTKIIAGKQKIQLELSECKPRNFKKGDNGDTLKGPSSWERPLIKCIPESARVISVLVSSRRRENVIKLVSMEGNKKEDEDDDENTDLSIFLEKSMNASFRWKRFNTNDAVYIDPNTVPATAVPIDDRAEVYCVCANTLEVRGGGIRAEGLSMLPQGKAFLLLARFTFGLFREENVEEDTIVKNAVAWIGSQTSKAPSAELREKIKQAVDFHHHALDLGEALECFPDRVAKLLDIFDGVDGYETKPWDSLPSNPLIRQNLIENQRRRRQENAKRVYRRESSGVDGLKTGTGLSSYVKASKVAKKEPQQSTNLTKKERQLTLSAATEQGGSEDDQNDNTEFAFPENFSLVSLSQAQTSELSNLFRGKADKSNMGSCNKLAELVGTHRTASLGMPTKASFNTKDWQIYSVEAEDSKTWFRAVFEPKDIGYRAKRDFGHAWVKKSTFWTARPRSAPHAMYCVPPKYKGQLVHNDRIASISKHLIFDDMKLATQMEAAFWLERQFHSKKGHWYDRQEGVSLLLEELKLPQPKNKPSAKKMGKVAKKKAAKKAKKKQQQNAARKGTEGNL